MLLADSVARSYGIRDSILSRFPEYGDVLYGMALVVALEPHRIMSLGDCFAGYCMEGIVERDRTRVAVVREAVGYLQRNARASIELDETPDKLYVFLFTRSSPFLRNLSQVHTRGEQRSYILNNSLFIVTDDRGNPLLVRSKDSNSEIVDTIATAMDYTGRHCRRPVLVLDRSMPVKTVARIAFRGFGFVFDATSVDGGLDLIPAEGEVRMGDWDAVTVGAYECRAIEVPLAVSGGPGRLGFARADGDPGGLRAILWYHPLELEDRMDLLRGMTRHRQEQLSHLPPEEAERILGENLESQFMTVEPDGNGGTRVRVRTKARRRVALQSCVHAFITNVDGLDECVGCMIAQRYLETQSGPLVYSMSENYGRSRYGNAVLAVEAMKVRAYTEIAAQAAGLEGTDVDLLYSEAARYGVVRSNGFLRRSSVPARTARLLERMGVDASRDLEGSDRLVRRRDGRARFPHPFL